jgi:hypothetical protein
MIFASQIQVMHLADRHLRMCGPFFKTTVSKSRRRWLLRTASCVYMSTLNSMFLILPRRSLSASTGWGCRGWRMATTVMVDQAPQATLNGVANCRRMVIRYHIVAEVTGPSLWNSGRNSEFRRIPKQINLALELFNSNVCSTESEVISEIPRIPKNEASQEPEYKTECTSKIWQASVNNDSGKWCIVFV